MDEYDLAPKRPGSPLRLQRLEYGLAKGSLPTGELASAGDIIVILRETQPRRFLRIGEVDEFISLLQRTDFDSTRESVERFSEKRRLVHVPCEADVRTATDISDAEWTVMEEDCPVCTAPVLTDHNAVADCTYGMSQILHVDCVDEFCTMLERVWEAPEHLLVDLI